MSFRSLICALAVAAASARAEPVKPPALSADDLKKLESGGIVVRSLEPTGGKGVAALAIGIIDAPTPEVWPIVRDCQYFKLFMPRTKHSELKLEEQGPLCHVELGLPFPLTNLWSDTKSVLREEPAGHYHRAWTLVRGTYHRNDGSWVVVPWGEGGTRTLVVYTVDSNPHGIIPDGLIRSAQMGSLPDIIVSIRRRLLDLRKTAPPPAAPAPAAPPAPDGGSAP